MKQKISKKLVINKTTVTDLNSKEMSDIKGGDTLTRGAVTCYGPYCAITIPPTVD
jgi:natural product precursor